jgi:hypothetical protein
VGAYLKWEGISRRQQRFGVSNEIVVEDIQGLAPQHYVLFIQCGKSF